MTAKISVGDSWGKLVVERVWEEDESQLDGAVTYTYPERFAALRCSCGNEVTIRVKDFPGRRNLRDCGCGAAARRVYVPKGPKPISERHVQLSVSLRMETVGLLQAYAQSQGFSASRAIDQLLSLALRQQSSCQSGDAGSIL